MYVVFEGMDGVGKTTVMAAVASRLQQKLQANDLLVPTILQTHHPGSTPLGKCMRTLVKYPEQIDPAIEIDDLSRQMLFMVDTVSFIKTVLEPALERGVAVFADRSSFISALAYGTSGGLDLKQINQLFQIIEPPKADRLYVLQCSWEVAKQRRHGRQVDHFEQKSDDYYKRVQGVYDNLITGPPERSVVVNHSVSLDNVIYVNATRSLDSVVESIVLDLYRYVIDELAAQSPP